MATTEQASPEPRRPRQFTLGGLMSFVVGWSAYCSTLAAVRPFVENGYSWDANYRQANGWAIGTTVAACWIVLWFLYRRWGLRHALRIHYAGPIIFTPLSLLLLFGGVPDPIVFPLVAAVYGCFVSIVIGFPIAVIMLFFVSTGVSGGGP
ncbi:MAG: hypothetical protein ABR915_25025 [Thermoguttaceae bacterium]|jgi:hypothetical protein